MNKKYKQLVVEEISMYGLKKKDRALIFQQAFEVIDAIDADANDVLGTVEDFVVELLELNELTSTKKSLGNIKSSSKKSGAKIAFGLALMVLAISMLVDLPGLFGIDYVMIIALIFAIALFYRKHYMMGATFGGVFVYQVMDVYTSIELPNFWLSIFAVWLFVGGFSMVFLNKKIHTHKHNRTKGSEEYINRHTHNHSHNNSNAKRVDRESIFVKNVMSSTTVAKIDDEITYIDVENTLGATTIDLSNFTYQEHQITVNCNNHLGDTTIFIGSNVRVIDSTNSHAASTDVTYSDSDGENILYLTGENNLGSVCVKRRNY